MSSTYDVIIIGLGGVGSSAAWHMTNQGIRVLGIDQFHPPHDRGSTHGETRIIRKAYFEHPSYVPLLCRAYDLWAKLEESIEEKLFHRTGLLEIGPENGLIIPNIKQCAMQFGLPIEQMSMREAACKFPGIAGDEDWKVILEKDAGYLKVEACVESSLKLAARSGATLRTGEKVLNWKLNGTGVKVTTQHAQYFANRLLLAAGPWAGAMLRDHGLDLQVLRKYLYWYASRDDAYREDAGFPCFFYETPSGYFYGFPSRDDLGVKVARHSGGDSVKGEIDGHHPEDSSDQSACESFLTKCIPDLGKTLTRKSGCYYTMTRDENFFVDRLPNAPQVTVVAGLSGHGFKFTSVLGEIAAHLCSEKPIDLDIGFLKIGRFDT